MPEPAGPRHGVPAGRAPNPRDIAGLRIGKFSKLERNGF
jgi:hypothetical protein